MKTIQKHRHDRPDLYQGRYPRSPQLPLLKPAEEARSSLSNTTLWSTFPRRLLCHYCVDGVCFLPSMFQQKNPCYKIREGHATEVHPVASRLYRYWSCILSHWWYNKGMMLATRKWPATINFSVSVAHIRRRSKSSISRTLIAANQDFEPSFSLVLWEESFIITNSSNVSLTSKSPAS